MSILISSKVPMTKHSRIPLGEPVGLLGLLTDHR